MRPGRFERRLRDRADVATERSSPSRSSINAAVSETNRTEASSDGVLAIAVTLLVLDLRCR
jgi:hypothetical protein